MVLRGKAPCVFKTISTGAGPVYGEAERFYLDKKYYIITDTILHLSHSSRQGLDFKLLVNTTIFADGFMNIWDHKRYKK